MAVPVTVEDTALRELRRTFRGELVTPSNPGYELHRRVWNGSIQRYPALVARCADAGDVTAAIGLGQRTGLPVAVRGGGHSFPGASVVDDGVVIDLSLMKQIQVDPVARTARVQGGVLVGELDRATQPFGLGVTGGIVIHTGMAGLTLGGGLGWLMRTYGLTIDQLLSVDLVTADGQHTAVDANSDPELFWGLRGGGGNFGVATSFTYRLHPVGPTVMAGPVFWPISDAPQVLRFYRDWISEAPDELMTLVVHRKAPPLPAIPQELWGRLVVGVVACYVGPIEDAERVLRPVKSHGRPVLDLCTPKPYVEHEAMFDASFPHGWWYYMRSCDVPELTDDIIELTVDHAARITSPRTAFPHLGGARARVPDDATAFTGRSAGHTFNITGATETAEGFDVERDWVRRFWADLEPHGTGAYVNFLMDEGPGRVRQAYGPQTLHRLRALKRRYDPANIFRFNQNIGPDEAGTSVATEPELLPPGAPSSTTVSAAR
jgi:FAD binding domain/Berberine and berberine like